MTMMAYHHLSQSDEPPPFVPRNAGLSFLDGDIAQHRYAPDTLENVRNARKAKEG